jgi:hypothetical protein
MINDSQKNRKGEYTNSYFNYNPENKKCQQYKHKNKKKLFQMIPTISGKWTKSEKLYDNGGCRQSLFSKILHTLRGKTAKICKLYK